jgi:hypothetical protein
VENSEVKVWRKTSGGDITVIVKKGVESYLFATNLLDNKGVNYGVKSCLVEKYEITKTSEKDIEEVTKGIKKISSKNGRLGH